MATNGPRNSCTTRFRPKMMRRALSRCWSRRITCTRLWRSSTRAGNAIRTSSERQGATTFSTRSHARRARALEVLRARIRPPGRPSPSMTRRVPAPARFEQEPGSPLGLVDPVLDQAGGRDVSMLIAHIVHLAQSGGERLVVLAQLGEHVERIDILGIVIRNAL